MRLQHPELDGCGVSQGLLVKTRKSCLVRARHEEEEAVTGEGDRVEEDTTFLGQTSCFKALERSTAQDSKREATKPRRECELQGRIKTTQEP